VRFVGWRARFQTSSASYLEYRTHTYGWRPRSTWSTLSIVTVWTGTCVLDGRTQRR